jgi:hypothetical protein
MKMYYVPTFYYWLDTDELYSTIRYELINNLHKYRKAYYHVKNNHIIDNMIEKTDEYYIYKSALVRIILMDYAHTNSNSKGKDLLVEILNKWMNSLNISTKNKKYTYERTIINIRKYEKNINNIENILMLISLQILENYYIN